MGEQGREENRRWQCKEGEDDDCRVLDMALERGKHVQWKNWKVAHQLVVVGEKPQPNNFKRVNNTNSCDVSLRRA
jgi:hypothetical protein